jgi:hypothetical protein
MLMLRLLLMVASFANCAGGIVLIATWTTMWEQVPPIVLFIGGSLLIQGGYTILYLHGELDRWGEIASGALLDLPPRHRQAAPARQRAQLGLSATVSVRRSGGLSIESITPVPAASDLWP